MPNAIVKIGNHRKLLEQLFAKSQEAVRIASPYVTENELPLSSSHKEVRLLTLLSPMDIVTGACSLETLRVLVEGSVKCRVLAPPPKLHAKVYIFDRTCAVVTSANLTISALDKNLEVGVPLRGNAVAKLIKWFDRYWESEAAELLTTAMITNLNDETRMMRKRFRKLRSMVSADTAPANPKEGPAIQLPSSASVFLGNTDRRHDLKAEKLMKEKKFAAAWETFDFTEHMKKVKRGDVILMYANGAGIIAVGKARKGYEILRPGKTGRVQQGDTPEWRVPVKWLRWVHSEDACAWSPHLYQTFVDVSGDDYKARRRKVWEHFKLVVA